MTDTHRAPLQSLSSALRKLHKLLIDCQSREFGAVGTPFDHLQLVTNHPDFAWLRVLSEYMVAIDERLDDDTPLSPTELGAFALTLEQLIGPAPATQPAFRERYLSALHDSPDLTIQHGAVRLALAALPREAS